MAKKICYGKVEPIWSDAGKHKDLSRGWGIYFDIKPLGVKRIRLTCPVCGRRVMSSIKMNHDGDFIIHTLPPHKPKKWWKKHERNRKKKNDSQIYRNSKRRI